MAINPSANNLHEFGPQASGCALSPIEDEDGNAIFDESSNNLCPETDVPTVPFIFTITGSSYAIGLESTAGIGGDSLVYNFEVDWGDGSSDIITAWDDAALTHAYAGSSTYTISIDGTCPNLSLGLSGPETAQRSKLTSIEQWGDTGFTFMQSAFHDCYNMTLAATDKPNFSRCTDIRWMFNECRSIVAGAEGWNFSNMQTTSIRYLFDHCDNFNCDLSGWNLTGITDMQGVLNYCVDFNNDITGWDTSAVTDMGYLFFFTESNNHASFANLDVSACTNFQSMLSFCTAFNVDISGWTIATLSGAVNMNAMFRSSDIFNIDIDGWNVSAVTDMGSMFADAFLFNQSLDSWDVSAVTDMSWMFAATFGIGVFNSTINSWVPSACITMADMFKGQNNYNQSIDGWGANTSNVTNTSSMFESCDAYNQSMNSLDFSSVTDMNSMFKHCILLNVAITGWDVSSVTNFNNMFDDCFIFNSSLSGWILNTTTPVTMREMFGNAWDFNQPLNTWNVSQVTDYYRMFLFALAFNGSLSGWVTTNATNMFGMFSGCDNFNQDIGGWNVSNVENFNTMLFDCGSFNQDISSWDISGGTDFNNFMSLGISFSTANYDLLLNAWSLLTLSANEEIDFASTYTIATSQAARDIFTGSPNNWTVNDGGGI